MYMQVFGHHELTGRVTLIAVLTRKEGKELEFRTKIAIQDFCGEIFFCKSSQKAHCTTLVW